MRFSFRFLCKFSLFALGFSFGSSFEIALEALGFFELLLIEPFKEVIGMRSKLVRMLFQEGSDVVRQIFEFQFLEGIEGLVADGPVRIGQCMNKAI